MLGSDQAGERSAAALKATEFLAKRELTWADVQLPGVNETDDLVDEMRDQVLREMAKRTAQSRAAKTGSRTPYPHLYVRPNYDPETLSPQHLREQLHDLLWAVETQPHLCTLAQKQVMQGLDQKLAWTTGAVYRAVQVLRECWGFKTPYEET